MLGNEQMVMEHIETLSDHGARIGSLEDHRKRQNGKLDRIESKLNWIGWGLAGTFGMVSLDLALRCVQ